MSHIRLISGHVNQWLGQVFSHSYWRVNAFHEDRSSLSTEPQMIRFICENPLRGPNRASANESLALLRTRSACNPPAGHRLRPRAFHQSSIRQNIPIRWTISAFISSGRRENVGSVLHRPTVRVYPVIRRSSQT